MPEPNLVFSGLQDWFEARYVNGKGAALPADGSSVTSMNTLTSGSNFAATNGPTFRTTLGPKSGPALEFDGVNDSMQSTLTGNTTMLYSLVVKLVTASPDGKGRIMDTLPGRHLVQASVSSTGYVGTYTAMQNPVATDPAGIDVRGRWTIVTVYITPAQVRIWVDGVLDSISDETGTQQSQTPNTWYLGSDGSSAFMLGHLAAGIAVQGATTDYQRAQWHSYVQEEYGITTADYITGHWHGPNAWVGTDNWDHSSGGGGTPAKVRKLNMGAGAVTVARLGSTPVAKVYKGTTLVFEA